MSESEQIRVTDPDREFGPTREADAVDAVEPADGDRPDDAGDEEEIDEIPLDIIFDILRNQRRRHVLRYLDEHRTTTLSDLAEYVAAIENDKDVQSLSSTERKRVYVGLYQCHLPRMDDAGVIDFDSNRGTVEITDRAAEFERYRTNTVATRHPWPVYYLSIAFGGGTLYAAAALFGVPASPAPHLAVVATLLAVVGCAVFHRHEFARDDAA